MSIRCLVLALALASGGLIDSLLAAQPPGIDYEPPNLLTGTIYEKGSNTNRVLFKFRRTAIRAGNAVHVLREYFSPDGAVAARERVTYKDGRFPSFELEELQTGATGRAVCQRDQQHPDGERIFFEYTSRPGARTEKKSEAAEGDVLINDMLPGFILSHWDELNRGIPLKFRYIVAPRAETIGFKLVKEGEGAWHNRPVVRIRMEPTSLVIARLVEPVHFTIEAGGAHRIFQYTGRTTPMIKKSNKWVDLDAVTTFDWNEPQK